MRLLRSGRMMDTMQSRMRSTAAVGFVCDSKRSATQVLLTSNPSATCDHWTHPAVPPEHQNAILDSLLWCIREIRLLDYFWTFFYLFPIPPFPLFFQLPTLPQIIIFTLPYPFPWATDDWRQRVASYDFANKHPNQPKAAKMAVVKTRLMLAANSTIDIVSEHQVNSVWE